MKNIIQLSIIVIVISSLWSCSNSANDSKKGEKKSATEVKLFTLSSGNVGENIQLPGVLQPFQTVQIFPKVNGFVKAIYVDMGTTVRKGQVMMTLDAPEIEEHMSAAKLKYAESVANIQTSKDKYIRLLETSKTPGTVSAYDLRAAHSKMMADSAIVEGELANYQAQKTMFSYLTVTAPFDGIITERNIHPGSLIGPGSQGNGKPLFVLQEQNVLRLVANIPEQYSSQIKDGEEIHYKVNALPGKNFVGHISRSSGTLSEHFRSETIEVDVPNAAKEFKAGMYAEVNIPAIGNTNAFKVPKTAVVTTTERKYILVVLDNIIKKVDVTEGNQDNDNIEIFGDLKAGEKIVSNANYDMQETKKVDAGS